MTRMLIRYRRDSDKDRKRKYTTSGRDWSCPALHQGMPMDQEEFSLRAFGGNGLGDTWILNFWPLEFGKNTFLLSYATQFVVFGYGSPSRPVHPQQITFQFRMSAVPLLRTRP